MAAKKTMVKKAPAKKAAPKKAPATGRGLKTLEKKYEGKAGILFVHVREQQVLGARYDIDSIPTQVFFDASGREVFRHTGFYPQDLIEKHLAELGAK